MMVAGLLDFLHAPKATARYPEREHIAKRIAEQMDVTCGEAREILSHFEADTDISGCERSDGVSAATAAPTDEAGNND